VRVAEPHDLRPSDSPVGAVSCARDAVASGFGRKNHAREKSNVSQCDAKQFRPSSLAAKILCFRFSEFA
jgi:hypothetical protein